MKFLQLMEEYKKSEDFMNDVSWYQNECFLDKKQVPSEEEAKETVLIEKQKYFEAVAKCEELGHDFVEDDADAENGCSNLYCKRCNEVFRCQW